MALSPVNSDWISLADVAAGHWWDPQRVDTVSYLDVSVRYINLFVDRDSLAKWIGEITQTRARYRTPEQDVVTNIARALWPNGEWKSLPVKVRNDKIISEAQRQGINLVLDRKTIKSALGH